MIFFSHSLTFDLCYLTFAFYNRTGRQVHSGSCSAQLISFEIDSISLEINYAEHKYVNMSPGACIPSNEQ